MINKQNDDIFHLSLKASDFESLKVSAQLTKKQEIVETLFQKKANPIMKNPNPRGYRHKAVLSATNIKVGSNNQLRLGFFEEGSKKIKPRIGHFLHHPEIDEIFKTVEKLLVTYKFKAYMSNYKEGLIKHVLIRKSYAFNQFMVVISTQGNLFPNAKDFIKELISIHPNITTVVQNIHRKDTKLVVLEEEKVLYGKGYIQDKIDDLIFNISPRAFYQINPALMVDLYHKALEMANISEHDTVLDCYSGIGTISLLAAKKAKMVYGLEINDASVKDAIKNKKENKVENVNFILGDVEKTIEEFKDKVDVLIMDPTRQGASLKFIQAVLNLKPKKIVYIACDPQTQFRDICQLTKNYNVKEIQPVDMFTYTAHVENIVLLSLRMR
ncbi:23S rRNA (uracil(1939)-C(5))-methyltransferase RlmD [Acholeplasma hippikon]|uniref:tRNA (Uracil-5-)-methyltransferase related enzyme n=1 Tax=Acholeplasma hippikon TaxID=264636 RepID=A0A449BIP7_9MOLU|nr:23S rRNA (uracil(1939)-C(5))-methyltransferase RlmD [Acholeplasma hippikon]VEU82310.1 tRNA (uracil-5-)-methyltransferase related enzyme [Acholeplasma hippikon]